MFRRLSWIVAILFAFIGGVIIAGVLVTSPELTNSGTVAETGDGPLSSPGAAISGVSGVVLWTVATTMCFGVGFMAMRMSGWLVLGLIPHSRHYHSKTGPPEDDEYEDAYEADEYLDETDAYSDGEPSSAQAPAPSARPMADAVETLVTDESLSEPQTPPEDLSEPQPERSIEEKSALQPGSIPVSVGMSEPRPVSTTRRPRVRIGRGVRSIAAPRRKPRRRRSLR